MRGDKIMTLQDAKEFVKIIRREHYKTTILEEQFMIGIELNGKQFIGGNLTPKQVKQLKAIYAKATKVDIEC